VIADDGTITTFAELAAWSDLVADWLAREHGVGEGAVVALVMPSEPTYIAAYLALAKLGAATAGVSVRLAPAERAAVLDRLRPDLVLEAVPASSGAIASRLPELADDPDRLVAIVCTSGSTGVPKGAMFRERQLRANVKLDVGSLAVWGTGGPILASTQFPHVGLMCKLPLYLRLGNTLLLQDRWRARRALELIDQHRVQSLGGVAAQIGLLLRVPDFDAFDVSSVQGLVIGAGASPAAVVREARERFGAGYSIRYSSTESGGCGTGTAFDASDEEYRTVGAPRPAVEVRIDPANDEVLLRSPAVMSGYWRQPGLSADVLTDDGWLRTGDLVSANDDGTYAFVGRLKEVIRRRGENLSPAEVETALERHASVAEAAVLGVPSTLSEEEVKAFVVPTSGAEIDVAALHAFAGEQLSRFKVPRYYEVVSELPHGPTGRLVKHRLPTERNTTEIDLGDGRGASDGAPAEERP